MTTDMREALNLTVDAYKQLRNELNADSELSDQERDWVLNNAQQSIQYQAQMLELESY